MWRWQAGSTHERQRFALLQLARDLTVVRTYQVVKASYRVNVDSCAWQPGLSPLPFARIHDSHLAVDPVTPNDAVEQTPMARRGVSATQPAQTGFRTGRMGATRREENLGHNAGNAFMM